MGNICIIGPTGAGKTTYLAGLAYWPEKTNPNFQITAITNDAKNLASKAENIICLLYTSPSPRDISGSRMPSSA